MARRFSINLARRQKQNTKHILIEQNLLAYYFLNNRFKI